MNTVQEIQLPGANGTTALPIIGVRCEVGGLREDKKKRNLGLGYLDN